MLPASVTVMEVSPRDGLQNEDVLVPTAQKLRLIRPNVVMGPTRVAMVTWEKMIMKRATAELTGRQVFGHLA